MYDTILFPTDGSDGADSALIHALDLAEIHGASLHAVYVVDTTYAGSGAAEVTTVDSLREASERVLDQTVDLATDRGVEIETETREGEPYREIIDCAEAVDADVVVMGTHGRRGLDRFLLGSVTEKVVRMSSVPVLTVRTADEG